MSNSTLGNQGNQAQACSASQRTKPNYIKCYTELQVQVFTIPLIYIKVLWQFLKENLPLFKEKLFIKPSYWILLISKSQILRINFYFQSRILFWNHFPWLNNSKLKKAFSNFIFTNFYHLFLKRFLAFSNRWPFVLLYLCNKKVLHLLSNLPFCMLSRLWYWVQAFIVLIPKSKLPNGKKAFSPSFRRQSYKINLVLKKVQNSL